MYEMNRYFIYLQQNMRPRKQGKAENYYEYKTLINIVAECAEFMQSILNKYSKFLYFR